MRLTFVASLLLTAFGLSACGGGNLNNDLAPVCAEQSEWATQGTVDGRYIAITCP
jgi:hypothetical protein